MSTDRTDPRYRHRVGDIPSERQPEAMRRTLAMLQSFYPGLGITLFVFDYGEGGGLMYGSTAPRADMLKAIREWEVRSAEGEMGFPAEAP